METWRDFTTLWLSQEAPLSLTAYDAIHKKPIRPGTPIQGAVRVGYGRDLTIKGLSEEEARSLLDHDLDDLAQSTPLLAKNWNALTPRRQGILAFVAYRTTPANGSFLNDLRWFLEQEQYQEAADLFLRSPWEHLSESMRQG